MSDLPPNLAPLLSRLLSSSHDVQEAPLPISSLPPLQLRRGPSVRPFDASLTPLIEAFVDEKGKSQAVKAALHLANDDLERAHEVAQEHEDDMSCNLCHAILHRREGDFWNSCWWLDRIRHPLLEELHGGRAGAKQFVRAVEAIVTGGGKGGGGSASTACGAKRLDELKLLQAREIRRLIEYTLSEGK